MKRFIMKILMGLGLLGSVQANDIIRPSITVKYISHSLNMNGKMSDPAWMQATAYSLELPLKAYSNQPEAIQKTVGTALREKGSVKLLWSNENIFISGHILKIPTLWRTARMIKLFTVAPEI